MRFNLSGKFIYVFVVTSSKRIHSYILETGSCARKAETKMKVFTQKRNPLTGSSEWDMEDEDYDFHQEIARSAFADMLHDTERNKKYHRALQLAIDKMHNDGKKANVLDIGTGTGLLSIMAARCGADTITACEAFKPMAECCLKILEKNGVADKINVIPKRSTEIIVGEGGDMKEKANILVTEVFDTELIGEGALSTFSHAHKYLLEEDCIVVPDSAIIYAQVVECDTLQKWNRLDDFILPKQDIVLKTPQKIKDCAGSAAVHDIQLSQIPHLYNIKDCPGSAAVHDIQLSQIPRSSFRELSEQIPVFYYDWSGKSPLDFNRTVKQDFTATAAGKAQMVFMWWELNMDTEGRIVLSCAPWWAHPATNLSSARPQDSIPWRDHWMQAVYYLPQDLHLTKGTEATLISCQDEYSLWFYLDGQTNQHKRPICECGIHMALSRTHVSYLNDNNRRLKFVNKLKAELTNNSVVLDLNGIGLLGLFAAKMAKKVYIVEDTKLKLQIIDDYIKENSIENVEIIPELTDEVVKEVTNVISDPNFTSAILPWENLKIAYLLYKHRSSFKAGLSIIPEGFEFWAMPVEFQDLQKIRVPLEVCEGINMTVFDDLVESSRIISDAEVEAQPLWEYPCKSRGEPRKIMEIDFHALQPVYTLDGTYNISDMDTGVPTPVNGFALWAVWRTGEGQSSGPVRPLAIGDWVEWDPHTRQAVKILKKAHFVNNSEEWCFQIACDLDKGQFNVNVNLASEQ